MEMTHDVLCVRFSPSKSAEKSLVAVGLLDATIKIFFNNSMKFFLSLYGHKLSVMCLDMSYDGNILVSGSADKTIKIWGLDFGDCHRSLLGHEDSVTAVRFQHETHYFFSAGKDGCVKYWDADRFQQILNLPGHFSCVWSLDLPMDGSFCVSASQDRSLRVWRRSEDLVFIEEERERAFEAQADSSAARDESAANTDIVNGSMERAPMEHPFSAVGSAQTVESLKSGERLLEAIDLVESELAEAAASGRPNTSTNPLLLRMDPLEYMVYQLKNIRSADLELALLVLPFHYVMRLIRLLCQLCERGTDVELIAKSSLFLFRAHQPRIMSTGSLAKEIALLSEKLRENLASCRKLVGTNMAALRFSIKHIEDNKSDKFAFREDIMKGDAGIKSNSGRKKKRNDSGPSSTKKSKN
jgi:U3 small nucleolar RNA-associated protein 12